MDNHSEIGRRKFFEAIEEATKELDSLERRAAHLRAFIAEGKILLGDDGKSEAVPSATMIDPAPVQDRETNNGHDTTQEPTIGDWARRYLEEVGKPMRATEIAKVLVERQWVTSRHATEAIRTAMGRRDDIERIAFGVYALKEWPSTMKRWTRRGSRPVVSRRKRTVQGLLPQLVYEVLAKEQKPLKFQNIIEVIENQGHKVNRQSAIRAIYRCASQGRLFEVISPGVFGLLDWRTREETNATEQAEFEERLPIDGHVIDEGSQQGDLSEAEDDLSYRNA